MAGWSRASWCKAVLLAIALAAGAAFALRAAQHGERWNTNLHAFDQGAYLHFAQKAHRASFRTWTDGARGPAYPFLLALAYRPGLSDEEHFLVARRLSIALALLAVVLLGLLLRRWLPSHAALNVLWVSTFSVFLFRAPYVQPEPLFFVAFFAAYVLACRSLATPGIKAGVKAGLALGVAHLFKPAVLPALGLLLMVGLGSAVASGWPRPGPWRSAVGRTGPGEGPSRPPRPGSTSARQGAAARHLAALLGTAGAFLVVAAPYLIANYRTFGHPFYNVNTTFYLWYDSWDEVKAGTRAHGDRTGWPDMPTDALPSPARYLAEHSRAQIVHRFAAGSRRLVADAMASYGYARYALLYAIAALLAAGRGRQRLLLRCLHRPGVVAFSISFFVVYLAGFAWFVPINYGERLVQSLFLPWLYSCTVVVHRWAGGQAVRWRGRAIPLAWGTEAIITALAVPDGVAAFGWRILRVAGGT